PHRGDSENFRLLLNLLQPDMFADEKLLRASINQGDNPLFLRRLKEDLRDFQGRPLFPPRRVITRAYILSEDEKQLYNGVTNYVEQQYNRALATDKRNVAFALLILQRRMASSVRAVRRSLERRRKRLEELLRMGQWLAQSETLDEEALEDAPEEERLRQEEQLVERLTAAETQEELKEEIRTLDELIRLATQAEKQEVETKLKELRRVLEDESLRQTGEKLLIFTESRDTLDYLVDKLRSWGYSVVALHGGQNLEERIRTEHEFRQSAQIMVSTEAGGEGINLQFCSIMVNYDIPWNPNRLEQRMGRIHRYGQQKEVHIYNLVAADTREGSVLHALFVKLERMASAMGSDRVFDVIGEVTTKNLRDLIVDAIARRRSLEDILAEIEAVPDEQAIQRAREATLEALASRHIDLRGVLGEHQRARESRLTPEYVEAFFEKACELLGVPLERRDGGLWRIRSVPVELRQVSYEFKRRYGEVQREYKQFTFVKEQARRTGAEFVGLGHPLLETILEQVQKRAQEALKRGASFADPEGKLDGWLWFVVGEVRDGDDQVVGSQMFSLYQSASEGTLCPIQSSVLWDLIPLPAQQEVAPLPHENREVDSVVTHLLESYRQELSQQRQHEAEIKRKYGLQSLKQRIVEYENRVMEYTDRRARGGQIPEAEIQRVERQLEDYQRRKAQLEQQILRETSLALAPPEIITVVRVVPQPMQIEEHPMVSDAEIEAVGMQVAMEYERRRGAEPVDVSQENRGYDIRSTEPNGTERYIEVKARATTGAIVLTHNEWLMAQRFGEDYWLYVVEHAATEPQLYLIQNPVANLTPEPIVETVRFLVQAQQWKGVATPEG
ncbi:MAG: helicase-related protein, partial [Fimbriimonadales bacterium]